MNRDQLEQMMTSHLYGELPGDEQKQLEAWLQSHPEDQHEFEELQRACAMLDRLKDTADSGQTQVLSFPTVNRPLWRHPAWAVAAAACFMFFLLASTQGIMLQVGSFRFGLGAIDDPSGVRDIVQQELTANYKPIINQMTQTMDLVKTSREISSIRLAALEETTLNLYEMQKNGQLAGDIKIKRALNELVEGLDQRLQPILTASPAMYRTMLDIPPLKEDVH
jgi:hypothetical protein